MCASEPGRAGGQAGWQGLPFPPLPDFPLHSAQAGSGRQAGGGCLPANTQVLIFHRATLTLLASKALLQFVSLSTQCCLGMWGICWVPDLPHRFTASFVQPEPHSCEVKTNAQVILIFPESQPLRPHIIARRHCLRACIITHLQSSPLSPLTKPQRLSPPSSSFQLLVNCHGNKALQIKAAED